MRIAVFGDSIGWGKEDPEKGGWVTMLKISARFSPAVYNCSISGDLTSDVLDRFDTEAAAREPECVIFAAGVNDAARLNGNVRCSLSQFKENIAALTRKARERKAATLWLGLFKADEARTTPTSWNAQLHYLNSDIEEYDRAIRECCAGENAAYLPLSLGREDLQDGLHPNTKGHEKIFFAVREFLQEEGILRE